MHLNSTTALSDYDKATLFNNYFHSVFSSSYHCPQSTPSHHPLPLLYAISESDIYTALQSIDPTKATGLDGINPKLLKYCATTLTSPLHHLFTQCLSQSNIPSEWRTHSITPIHKSGDKTSITNYRPISLLCCTSLILERIIYSKIIVSITDTVITKYQFSFLANRSTIQQLLIFLN